MSSKENPQLLSSITGAVVCAAVKGTAVYASLTQDRVMVLDCSDPKNPRSTGTVATREWPVGMTIDGNYLYVAELGGGVEVFDISDASAPRRVGGNSRYIVTKIAAASDRLYFATRGDSFTPAYKFRSARIGAIARENSAAVLKVQGPPALRGTLEFTPDFTEWFEGATVVFGDGESVLTHGIADPGHQFYRLRLE